MAEKIASLHESLDIVPGKEGSCYSDSLALAGAGYSSGAASSNAVATLNKRELTKLDIEAARLLDAWLPTNISMKMKVTSMPEDKINVSCESSNVS